MSGAPGLDPVIEYHVVNSLGWPGLRHLQKAAVAPIRAGDDCVLLAPTAGGKTEAAAFPLLSQMTTAGWSGTSVLYVTPLRALLNDLLPRLESYTAWIGRTTALWHGDVGPSERRRILADRPDVLLTTPESLEAMLVSRTVDHSRFFSGLQTVVIDELHSFAGSDRGWHLLAILERVERVIGRKLQRVGLSATIGNPQSVGEWMQGSTVGRGPLRLVEGSAAATAPEPKVTLDYVGSMENAATVISRMHRGEKRLVFLESRRRAEELAFLLRECDVQTYVSHSSLSVDQRRQSEQAFAEAQDTVIVATSTLELGIDIGDLDRMIQIDAPKTVSSFLQRLGRTGRRAGGTRNALFLTTSLDGVLDASALLLLWKRGFVEDVMAPPYPRHLAAQQFMALALQEGRFVPADIDDWWGDLPLMANGPEILDHLRSAGFLVEESGLLSIGPRAEEEFGKRHFIELLSSFVAAPELRVVAGAKEIGFVSPLSLPAPADREKKPLILAGRGWHIRDVDWNRFTVWVEEVSTKGDIKWPSNAIALSYEMTQARRDVLLGQTPDVDLSKRFPPALERVREDHADEVSPRGLVVWARDEGQRVWTWAGLNANATLLAGLGLDSQGVENDYVDWPPDAAAVDLDLSATPNPGLEALTGLKFAAALPLELAARTLGERLADNKGAELTIAKTRVLLQTPKA
ncbi:DEAD/DEAH box helicase [Pseudoclavibacter helvolus]|uniref:DEAD/DEAH box helicase n=1 Tax=Pseudoclavibacter helvolus TaxID=255205 RepID=UPI003736F8D7